MLNGTGQSRFFHSFRSDIWTRSGCGACALYVGEAEVIFDGVVRASEVGPESNVCTLLIAGRKGLDDLRGRVTYDDVAADQIVTGSVKEKDSVGVSAYIVVFDPVLAAMSETPSGGTGSVG